MKKPIWTAWLLLAAACGKPAIGEPPSALLGAWKSDGADKATLARFDAKKVILFENGKLDIFAADYQPGRLVLSAWGQTMTWNLELKGDLLSLQSTDGKLQLRYRRLKETPPELEIRPMKLVPSKPVPADKLQEIAKELARRKEIDQAVRTDPAMAKKQPQVDADNYAYLMGLVKEHGWIDATRFGPEAAVAAFLIAQHSGDLGLLLAALPLVEADSKANRIGQSYYASMYDRVQALQAEWQRYGTQLGQNEKGEMVVLPLQDRTKVDEYRKEMGLPPLADYLEDLRRRHGWKIRFADE